MCVRKLAGSTSNLEGDCWDHLIITSKNPGSKYFGFLSAESELNYAIFTVNFGMARVCFELALFIDFLAFSSVVHYG